MFVLKAKSKVLAKLKEWKTLVERQSEHKVKVLRMDNDGEYVSKAFDDFLLANMALYGKPYHLACRNKMPWWIKPTKAS